MNTLTGIGTDFIRMVFDILLFLLLLRLLLQLTRADFYNPLSQAIVRTTAFLDPLRRTLGVWHGLDITTFLAILLLKMLAIAVIAQMVAGVVPGAVLLLAGAGISLIDQLAMFYFVMIIVVVILSFVAPDGRNPAAQLTFTITEPVLGPARRLLPPMGGLDFSPIIVMFLIHVIRAYLVPLLAQVTGVPGWLL
jgi:YggT family protein